jgi:nucleoid DNA-binding protein
MTKAEIVAAMAEKMGSTKRVASDALDAFIDTVTEAVANGEEVKASGLCTFKVVSRAARKGRNPKTGASIMIPATKALKISGAKPLKEAAKG